MVLGYFKTNGWVFRAQFLRFQARDRLPLMKDLKRKSYHRNETCGTMDRCLPEVATCSFTMTLPRYSSEIIMENKLELLLKIVLNMI